MVDNESQEMYLETILKIRKRKGSVRAIEIAEELGYSKPSVSRAVGIMKKDGFIIVRPDGQIELTESGKVKAENILARHKSLTEALIKMGLEQKAAEENACRGGTRNHRGGFRSDKKTLRRLKSVTCYRQNGQRIILLKNSRLPVFCVIFYLLVCLAVGKRKLSVRDARRNYEPYGCGCDKRINDYRADCSRPAENHGNEIEIENSEKSPVYRA